MTLVGQELWVGDSAGGIYILDGDTLAPLVQDGNPIAMKTEYGKGVHSLTACSTLAASGGADGVVTLFDIQTRTKKSYVKAHHNKVLRVAFTKDESWCVSIGFDKMLYMLDVQNTNSKRKLECKSKIYHPKRIFNECDFYFYSCPW